jgi:SAM-dependent methyltransferase
MTLSTPLFLAIDARAYEHFMARSSRGLAGPFLDFAGIKGGNRVLDVGCGTGVITAALAERGCTVVGLDASEPYAIVSTTSIPNLAPVSPTGRKPRYGVPIKNDQARMTGAIFYLKCRAGWNERDADQRAHGRTADRCKYGNTTQRITGSKRNQMARAGAQATRRQ